MNQVAYEKGALFLIELERVFGRERFDPFLRGYFDAHAFQSITTADFVAYLKAHLLDPNPALAAKIDVAAWVHQPGLTVGYTEPTSPRLDAVDTAAHGFALGTTPVHRHQSGRLVDAGVAPFLAETARPARRGKARRTWMLRLA